MRSVLRQKILKPKDVAVYSEGVNEVITDLIKRIHTLRSQEDDGETVTNINNLFFKYSMEGKPRLYNIGKENAYKAVCLWLGIFVKWLVPHCDWSEKASLFCTQVSFYLV